MRYWFVFIVIAASAGMFAFAAEDAAEGDVWLVDLDGPVGPASVDLVIRSIENATEAGAQAVVIRMDTPGGLDKSMRDLVKAILASDIPVITYVSPDGARAASAGTYIAYASHIAAMAPATNIGSSTPVSIAPTVPQPTSPTSDDEPAAAPPADAMTKKVVNDAVAYLQSLAELRGRNIEWAEETVREGANLRATEALEQNVIDVIAPDLATLLDELDGWEVKVGNGTQILQTAGALVVRVETDWRHELLSIITDPSIAYGLLIIGVYGIILEFYSPGMVFPAVTGVICLLLGAYGLQMLPINYAGLALIVVGIGLMVAEVLTPTYGVLGVGGLAAFVFGSVMLMDSDIPGYQLPIPIIAGFAIATGGVAFFVVGSAIQARRQKVVTGVESMIGAEALVLDDFDGRGSVRAFGEVWGASSAVPLQKNTKVRVTRVDGLTLTVEPED
ncbi:MAG: nodulation protein NfeD [Gammaproteobacteria bacterium]|nr:nodulation protein NfeD [Gammaproteobacteria bacterium]